MTEQGDMLGRLIRVVDVETTGIDDPAEMVEFGWTDIVLGTDGSWKTWDGPRSVLVNPGMPISFPAMAVHHIPQIECQAFGVDPDELRAEVPIGADFFCAHNAAFDGRFLRGHSVPWICTFKAARTAWPDLQSHSNGSIRYELGLCLYDEAASPSHRSGPDTWITAHILLELLKLYTVEQLVDITAKPVLLRKLGFGEHFDKPIGEVPWSYLDWILNKSRMPEDPSKEDVVHTVRMELARRAAITSPQQPATLYDRDPDAWRSQVGAT